jgi:hypothetical protein
VLRIVIVKSHVGRGYTQNVMQMQTRYADFI